MCHQLPTFNLALSDKNLNIPARASVTTSLYGGEAFHLRWDYRIPRERSPPALRNSPCPTEPNPACSSLPAHQNSLTRQTRQAVPKQKLDCVHSKLNSPPLKAISEDLSYDILNDVKVVALIRNDSQSNVITV